MLELEIRTKIHSIPTPANVCPLWPIRQRFRNWIAAITIKIRNSIPVGRVVSPGHIFPPGINCRDRYPDFDEIVETQCFLTGFAINAEDDGEPMGPSAEFDGLVAAMSGGIAPGAEFDYSGWGGVTPYFEAELWRELGEEVEGVVPWQVKGV
jgi:hypothetical protein